MANDVKAIVHAADPEPLIAHIAERHPRSALLGCDSYQALPALLDRERPDAVYSIRFGGTPTFPSAALKGARGPRWLAIGGVGVDHLQGWDPERLTVTNSAGVAASMMAEWMIGAFMHFNIDAPGLMADQRARRWRAREVRPLAGAALLILGLGHTGRALAARAAALSMKVIGVRARPRPTAHVEEVRASAELPELWGRADAIAICVPLLDATRGLVNEAAFAAMNDGVLIADVSRGGVTVGADLLAALRSGKVRGAALDVFEREPLPADSPFWTAPNCLISPHCSSVFPGWELASIEHFSRNLDRFERGRPLENVVDPARGY